jgi:hypothetical protein
MQGRLLQNAIRRLWGVLHERFAVHLTLSIACVALQLMYSANLNAQVELTATEGSTTGSYATLNEAFGAINAGTHKGAIAIVITANTTEPATPTPLLKSDGTVSDYTSITIKPGGAGEDVTINSAAAPATNRGVIEFAGADNVTIDGDDPATEGTRNLRIHAAVSSTTGIAAIRISSNSTTGEDGADNITIKNCIITGSLSNPISTSTLSYGIQFSNGTSTSSSSAGAYSNLNTLIENNLIERCYYGIHAIGASVSYPNTGLRIRNNSIGSSEQASSVAFRGIGVSYTSATAGATSAIIEGNDVRTGFPTAPSNMASIHVDAGNAGLSINGNYIHDSFNTSSSVWGMHGIGIYSAVSNASISITNNVIRDMRGYAVSSLGNQYGGIGIFVNAGATGLKIINNTIAQINSAIVGTCILINSADATVEKLVNNILHNSISNTNSCCLYINNPNNIINAQVDHNNYYVLPIGKIGYYTAARSTFDAWRTATGKDVNSFNTNPTFVSDTDLHLQPGALSYLESSGINVEELDTDFDGDSRPGPAGSIHGGGTGYDIGADEFDGIQVTCMPVGILSYTGVTNDGASFNWTAPASNPSPNYGWELRSSGAAGSGPDGLMASGETTLNNIVVPGIEVETNYVFYVRILCSDEDNSEWISQSIYTGHCFPTGGSGTYRITNVTTANGLTNINNTSVFSEGGYGEYMDQQVSVIPAASFNINITNAGGTCYFYVWVDWNGDYDFNDAGEAVIATTTYANNYAGTITLPGSVGAGSYRMRVAVSGSGAITSPCGPAPSGEFEDYMIEVVSLECYPPSNVTAQLQPPTSATISWNAALEQPEGYEWEVRTSGAAGSGTEGLFASGTTDIATLSAELTGLDASMTYHVYVRSLCADEATSPWTSSSFYNGACIPTGLGTTYRITNVNTEEAIININNTSVLSPGGYADYTSQSVIVLPAASFDINITNAGGTCYFYVWVDWNGDYDFNDAGEAIIATTSYANNYSGTINVPGTVAPGAYRMRVAVSGSGAITSPCGPAPSGEFEDYMVIVISGDCYPPSNITTQLLPPTSATISWEVGLEEPESYEWEVRTEGAAGSGTEGLFASGTTDVATLSAELTGLAPNLTYQVYVRSICADDATSPWTSASFYNGACTPTGGSGTYRITNVSTAQGLNNINNTSAFSTGGYADYTSQQVMVLPAATFNINITNAGGTCYFYVWADWNGDYDFNDAGEAIIATTSYANNFAGTITVPSSVLPGSYTMRVAVSGSGAITSPCGPAPNGEFEDYTIQVISVDCYPPSNITTQLLPPTSATISWAAGLEEPESYEWEVRTEGAAGSGAEGLFASGTTDLATLSAELTGLAPSVTYQVYVRSICADDATSPWTSTSFYNGTCIPTGGSGTYRITNVTTSNGLTNLNNASVFSTGGYGDYTEQQVDVLPAGSFNINITNAGGTCYFYVWADWNNDYDFNDAGEAIIATTSYANNYAGTITIPGSVLPGSYRMRVAVSGSGAITSPCGPAPNGEFEDYTIHVIELDCYPPANITTQLFPPTSATINWDAALEDPESYEWEVRTGGEAGSGAEGLFASGTTDLITLSAELTGLTPSETYYVYVRSICADDATSPWTSASFYNGACIPTGLGTNYRITNVTTSNALENINNTSVLSPGGYADYTEQQVDVLPAGNFNINITNAGGTCYFYVWADWNNDYDFNDAGEAIIATTTYANNFAGSITVPGNVAPGSYRMRVAVSGSGAITSPCGPSPGGEFEDYTIHVVELDCYPPANVTAQLLPPTSATISWNAALEEPESYEWEVRTSGAAGSGAEGLFASGTTDVATLSAALTDLEPNVTYHVYVRSICSDDETSPWTSSSFYNGLCVPTGGSGNYRITNVTTEDGLNNINNTSTFSTGGYGDYTEQQVEVMPASSFDINITNAGGTCYFYVWADWNNDYDFTDAGEAIIATTSYANNFSGTITVPNTVAPGSYRMRVAVSGSGAITSPCGPAPNGEFEDYTVVVVSTDDCYPPVGITVPTVNATNATIVWSVPVFGEPIDYEYVVSPNPAEPTEAGTSTGGALTVTVEGLIPLTQYYVFVRAICEDDNLSGWVGPVQFATPLLAGCDDPTACNYDPNVNINDGSCVYEPSTWYLDADGDGFGAAADSLVACAQPEGYVTNNTDCDDNDETVWQSGSFFADADGDGYDAGTETVCYGDTIPAGYVETTLGTDCDDQDENAWQSASLYIDADGDGYDSGTETVCYGDNIPTGYSDATLGNDCNDDDAESWGPEEVEVSLVLAVNEVCHNSAPFTLTGGTPAGGTWSSTSAGLSGSTFSPGVAGEGNHTIVYTVAADGVCSLGGSASATITVNICPGVDEESINEIVLYPTYTNGNVTIVGTDLKEAVIMGLNGQVINTVSLFNTSVISMQEYSAGIYFVRVVGENKVKTFKVVKVN